MTDVGSGRDMRGASYMDQYDSANNVNTYDTGKDKKELSSCARCSQAILFAVNFIMLLIGIVLIVVVMFVKENGDTSDIPFSINDTVVWTAVAAGGLIIIVSFLGCVGAARHAKCILVVYIMLLVVCLLLEIVAIVVIFMADDLLKDEAEKQWDGLSAIEQQQYGDANDCSGFNDCYSSIEADLKQNMIIIGGFTIGVFVYQLIMTVFACCLCSRKAGSGGVDHYEV